MEHPQTYRLIVPSWKATLKGRPWEVVITFFVLAVSATSYSRFLGAVERRPGATLADPLHALIPPIDLTWVTFGLLYGAVILTVIHLLPQPDRFLRALRAYTIVVGMRITMMWVTPLDPPPAMIPLSDPIVAALTGGGAPFGRDLFFSGHTSLLVLAALVVESQLIRRLLLGAALAVAIAVVLQHVHYTVDVLVAPLAAYAAARITAPKQP
jgi:PAP2 superfamily C-terminal